MTTSARTANKLASISTMFALKHFDNLFSQAELPGDLPEQVKNTILQSLDNVNHGAYSDKALNYLRDVFNAQHSNHRLRNMYFIAAYHQDSGQLAGFAGIEKTGIDNGYEYTFTYLQVKPEFTRKGLGTYLNQAREGVLLRHHISDAYTRTLLFPETIQFQFASGFGIHTDQRGLNYHVRMHKKIG